MGVFSCAFSRPEYICACCVPECVKQQPPSPPDKSRQDYCCANWSNCKEIKSTMQHSTKPGRVLDRAVFSTGRSHANLRARERYTRQHSAAAGLNFRAADPPRLLLLPDAEVLVFVSQTCH